MRIRARRSAADQLQQRFEAVPLDTTSATPVDDAGKVRSMRTTHSLMAVLIMFPLLFAAAPVTLFATWWGTRATTTCTVSRVAATEQVGRGGRYMTYVVRSDDCPQFRIVTGGTLDRTAVRLLGDSLEPGVRYRFDLRGWDGFFGSRAIVAASRL
ncbi:hypothetical protein ABIC47_001235 [Leifsonia sp. 563]|uniref:hypothetical protein n=1 Tax=Leifsonia sp. 563 TaxID=3156412 RepID=UPI00339939EE